jgi:aspartyl-tRNA(Asn)/glutamyl-tRNA(Gln) amidotransferase subunit C
MSPESRQNSADIDVAYVANLARLELTPEEAGCFQSQLQDIVSYVRKIGEADLADVEPTAHAVPIVNVLRPDAPRDGLDRGAVLANAPATVQDQFQVPKIVE